MNLLNSACVAFSLQTSKTTATSLEPKHFKWQIEGQHWMITRGSYVSFGKILTQPPPPPPTEDLCVCVCVCVCVNVSNIHGFRQNNISLAFRIHRFIKF